MLNCLIVDDEPVCIETLQLLLQNRFASMARVVASTNRAREAADLIRLHRPDILFLDVEMPHLTGLDVLKEVEDIACHVIFTTAHQHYALQAIKHNALDYLLKPIDLDDLATALHKCISRDGERQNGQVQALLKQLHPTAAPVKKIALPTHNMVHLVPVADITRIEAQSNYSIVHFTNSAALTVARTLKEFEEQLQTAGFLRVHHSHLVNLEHIIGYKNVDSGYVVLKSNELIEISRRKKAEVMQRLGSF